MARFLLLVVFISCVSHANMLPLEAFGSLPAASQARLSPNGERMAYMENAQGQTFVVTVDLNTGDKKYLLSADNQELQLDWYRKEAQEPIADYLCRADQYSGDDIAWRSGCCG